MTRPQFAPRVHRAQQRLHAWPRLAPHRAGFWDAVDQLRAQQGQTIPRWPRWCYLPLPRAGALVAEAQARAGMRPTTASILRESSELATLAAWRMTQGVYRYDPTLYAALTDTSLSGDLPAEILRRLPEWCVYIETPGMTGPLVGGGVTAVHGCWAWLDYEVTGDLTVLTLGLDLDDAPIGLAHVPLVGTIEDAIASTLREWDDAADRIDGIHAPPSGYAEAARRALPPLVSLVLYLCADDPDLGGRPRPTKPQPVRTKHGWRVYPASGLTRWDVGVRIGAAIRHAQEQREREAREHAASGRAFPRPHVRRSHWHSYWTGPRSEDRADERRLSVRWLPPIPVNVDGVADLPTTIHPVEEA